MEEDTGGHGKRKDMKRENFDHGFAEEAWEAAKAEARQAMTWRWPRDRLLRPRRRDTQPGPRAAAITWPSTRRDAAC